MTPRKTPEQRFQSSVDTSGDCWLWIGPQRYYGAGEFTYMLDGRQRSIVAHRAAWEFLHGPVPDGKKVVQLCGNSLCVKPAHLRLSPSRLTRMQAMYVDKDMPEKPPRCPERDWLFFTDHVFRFRSYEALAAEYGLALTTVRAIVEKMPARIERARLHPPRPVVTEQPVGVSDRDWQVYQRRVRTNDSLALIGQAFGISRERVRQIVNAVETSAGSPSSGPFR